MAQSSEFPIYSIVKGQLQPTTATQLDNDDPVVAFLTLEQLRANSQQLGVDMRAVGELTADQSKLRNTMDVFEDFSIGVVNIVDLTNVEGDRDQLLFIVRKKRFYLVVLQDLNDSLRRLFDATVTRYQHNATIEKMIFGVLERFVSGNASLMEKMDAQMLALEQHMVEGRGDKRLNRTIYDFRQQLTVIRNYYEQLIDIGEELLENENDLFEDSNLHYFRLFVAKAERLLASAQLKSENLVHLREALDAELNYTLNNVMKVFTVITAIFSPLTLIVGWYGMNFQHMPELKWAWAYPALLIVCTAITVAIIWLFKRKRFM